MYSILVVDDETWIRNGIISKVENTKFNFSRVDEAANGLEALERAKANKYDIIITDIKMPHMDGIEFLQTLKALGIESKIIIISGYAEFEYAMQAINLGAAGYLLKPFSDEAFYKTLEDLYFLIKKSRLTISTDDSEALEIEKLLNEMLFTNEHEALKYRMKDMKIFQNKKFKLAMIIIDEDSFESTGFKNQDVYLVKYALRNVIFEIAGDFDVEDIFPIDNIKNLSQLLILMCDSDEQRLEENCNKIVQKLAHTINTSLPIKISIAASEVCAQITNNLYNQCKEASNLRFSQGFAGIYKYSRNETGRGFSVQGIPILQGYIKNHDLKQVEFILDEIFSEENLKDCTGQEIEHLYAQLVSAILLIIPSSQKALLQDLEYFCKTSDVIGHLYKYIASNLGSGVGDNKNLVIQIKKYIDTNYVNEITVKSVSKDFFVHPNYLSTLFKLETGMNFTKYLNEVRISHACKILKNSKINNADVAKMVGYQDCRYFHRVFKRVTGLTPLEYKLKNN